MLGFKGKVIEYCHKCNVKYNSTNNKDVQFHNKIHKIHLIPKCTKIANNLHQKGNVFYYGQGEIEAKCVIRWKKGLPMIKELWATTLRSKKEILHLLTGLYGIITD